MSEPEAAARAWLLGAAALRPKGSDLHAEVQRRATHAATVQAERWLVERYAAERDEYVAAFLAAVERLTAPQPAHGEARE